MFEELVSKIISYWVQFYFSVRFISKAEYRVWDPFCEDILLRCSTTLRSILLDNVFYMKKLKVI